MEVMWNIKGLKEHFQGKKKKGANPTRVMIIVINNTGIES